MEFKKIIKRALKIRERYEEYEQTNVGRIWSKEQIMEGLIVDVGDLMRLIMAKEGYRKLQDDVDKRLKHELSDCLWALIILSTKYDIDLESAFIETMNHLENELKEKSELH